MLKMYEKLCNDPDTANLPVAKKYTMLGMNKSTMVRWSLECYICRVVFSVIKGNLACCTNCHQNLCMGCISRLFSMEITQAYHGDYQELHTLKCPYCQHPHAFCPASGTHGMQSCDGSTPTFNNQVLKITEAGVDKLHGMEGKLSTALCSHKGKFKKMVLQGKSKHEVSPRDVSLVHKLSQFSKQFGEQQICQSELVKLMKDMFRYAKWVKNRSEEGSHSEMLLKINNCDDAIDGLRDYVFDLCCSVYEKIGPTKNICRSVFSMNWAAFGLLDKWRSVVTWHMQQQS